MRSSVSWIINVLNYTSPGWISIDATSQPYTIANTVPQASGGTTYSPMFFMGGLPTTCPAAGTFPGTLRNNSGVLNVCP